MNILLLTLDTFSRTGGIQQFNRCLQLALCKFVIQNGGTLTHKSLMDAAEDADDKYAVNASFTFLGYRGFKGRFIAEIITQVHRFDLIIFGHVNLVPLTLLPALKYKDCRLVAHGIEIWGKLPFLKRRGLKNMQRILAVSHYTTGVIEKQHKIPRHRIDYFPNCLDPFFAEAPLLPVAEWNKHWRLDIHRTYLLTLARIKETEQAKGYDTIIRLLPALIARHPNLCYLLAGKYDTAEYTRIRQLADTFGVADRVLMPGFVAPERLPALYNLAKIFVMPSQKEGFGIVYLEAGWWGCPVVANRCGGVPEALLDGKLGILLPPENEELLLATINNQLEMPDKKEKTLADNRALISSNFGFEGFCNRLFMLLSPKR